MASVVELENVTLNYMEEWLSSNSGEPGCKVLNDMEVASTTESLDTAVASESKEQCNLQIKIIQVIRTLYNISWNTKGYLLILEKNQIIYLFKEEKRAN